MIGLDGEFENASLGQVTQLSPTWFHIGMRPDTAYWTHFRVSGCKGREITFTLTYTVRRFGNRWGTRDSGNPEDPDMGCRNPYLSYDGKTWQHFDFAQNYLVVPDTVCFRHTFEQDEAFVCFTIPYTYTDLTTYLAGIANEPRVHVGSAGVTADGNDVPLVTLSGREKTPEVIMLICREDGDEPTSNCALEGMIGRLTDSSNQKASNVLERCTFRIVPMVAIDAVILGSPYGGPYGVMARRWLDEKPLPEIEGIKAVVADCFANYDVRLMGKLHGGQTYDNPPVWDFRVFDLQLRKLIPDRVSDEHDPEWNPFLLDAVPWVRKLTIFESHLQKDYDFWNFFSVHTNGGDPGQLRRQGARFADLLCDYVLGPPAAQ